MKDVEHHLRKADYQLRSALIGLLQHEADQAQILAMGHAIDTVRTVRGRWMQGRIEKQRAGVKDAVGP